MTTYLGLDYGEKRVGVAVNDETIAQPLTTLVNDQTLLERLQALIAQHNVAELVIGLPRNLDGDDTRQTAVVRVFATEALQPLGLPLHFQDEAVTSETAAAGGAGKADLDQAAATIILQDFLDEQSR